MRFFVIITSLAALAACGNPAVDNPGFMSLRVNDGQISGSYNPAGFTSAEVQRSASDNCVGGNVASYTETQESNGLIGFVATCTSGTVLGGGVVEVQS